jgi:nickel transport protein
MSAKVIAMFRHFSLLLALTLAPQAALPHAALIEAEALQAIHLRAFYDTGQAMAGAQVMVFAPDNPTQAHLRGKTDQDGRFLFAAPNGADGRWTVQVRQAGHGAMTHVDIVGASPVTVTQMAGADWKQRAVMIALVAWGALGTALFALRDKGRRDAST